MGKERRERKCMAGNLTGQVRKTKRKKKGENGKRKKGGGKGGDLQHYFLLVEFLRLRIDQRKRKRRNC